MGVHIDNVGEHLRALLRQESSAEYHIDDYLGPEKRKILDLPMRSQSMMSLDRDDDDSQTSVAEGTMRQDEASWALTTQGRWQIGQWFYRSKLGTTRIYMLLSDQAANVLTAFTYFACAVIADFKFPREFAMVSMNYLDRVLSRIDTPPQSKEEVQLIALTCFYLAVKLFQAGPVLSTEQMAMLSGGMYTAQQVSAMELRILFVLHWSLHPPCAADFVRPFFMLIMRKTGFPPDLSHFDVLELALGMLHTGILDYFFIAHQLPPSHMAAAALLNAMHAILPSSYDLPSVKGLVQQIEQDTNCTMHEGQINLCRQRFWVLLDGTGLGRHCADSPSTYHQHCPTTPPPAKRVKSEIVPSSPLGVLDVGAVQNVEQLQAPFQVHS